MAAHVELEAFWGRHRVPFLLRRAEVKRLRIVVHPEGQVSVTAPLRASDEEVCARVSRRGDWILRQQERFELWRPRTPARQYLSGETHLFLGRQIRLQVLKADVADVKLADDRLVVRVVKPSDRTDVRGRVDVWYGAQARKLLRERYTQLLAIWRRHDIVPPRLIVRSLSNRWGSLTAAGNLVLNADLVRASPHLIDYVIAHEVAHVKHADHGAEWRRLLERIMPDWERRKRELEKQLL